MQRQPERASFWGISEKLTVIGLPLGAALSLLLALLSWPIRTRVLAAAGLTPTGFSVVAFHPLWHLLCVAVPLASLWALRLTESKPLRTLIAFVMFQVWMALYLATVFGIAWPALEISLESWGLR